jgi:formylmethanofuran dehydrogenase subunit E
VNPKKSDYTYGIEVGLAIAKVAIRDQKTIEPQRKKGHWIRHPEQRNIFNGKTIECSECHEKYTVQYVEDEWFCRHCGADMREDGAECLST